MFQVILNPGSQQWITLSLESISTIPFQVRASDVMMPELRQPSWKCRMQCFVNGCGTIEGTGDQPDMNPGVFFKCMADIFSNITNCEIQQPGMLIAQNLG
jgi:hypothetical protein